MCQKNRHKYVSFDIDTNCVEIVIENKEGGTKNFIKGIEYRQKNFSHQKSEFMESENRFRTSVKKWIWTLSHDRWDLPWLLNTFNLSKWVNYTEKI